MKNGYMLVFRITDTFVKITTEVYIIYSIFLGL
jgi:hypothetical protein